MFPPLKRARVILDLDSCLMDDGDSGPECDEEVVELASVPVSDGKPDSKEVDVENADAEVRNQSQPNVTEPRCDDESVTENQFQFEEVTDSQETEIVDEAAQNHPAAERAPSVPEEPEGQDHPDSSLVSGDADAAAGPPANSKCTCPICQTLTQLLEEDSEWEILTESDGSSSNSENVETPVSEEAEE